MKIAMIAMSGIRAHNPELTEMGMTLPGFVERGRAIASLPSLSLLTLAALTPDRHEISYHEIHEMAEAVDLPDAELVAIASFTAQVKDAYELSDRYRRKGVTTVMGGLHVTSRPEEALGHADIIVIGEGEEMWPLQTIQSRFQLSPYPEFIEPTSRRRSRSAQPVGPPGFRSLTGSRSTTPMA